MRQFNMHISTQTVTKTRRKKCCNKCKLHSQKTELQLHNSSFSILFKIASMNKCGRIRSWLYGAACPGKKAAYLVGWPWKMVNFICKEISDCVDQSLHSTSSASSVNVLVQLHKMPIQVGQPVKRERVLF